MGKLLVTGSIALDRIAVFHDRFANHILPEKVHRLNVAFNIKDMTVNHGGTGANIAYNLALMGDDPVLAGTVGNDAKDYIKTLEKHKIDCSNVLEIQKKLTAHATIMTDMDDNQITAFYMGAMAEARRIKLNPIVELLKLQLQKKAPDPEIQKHCIEYVVIAPNDIPAMLQYARECFEMGLPFIADPGQAIPGFKKEEMIEFISGADILICNDYELEMIQEKTGLTLADIVEKAVNLIVTYGENGSKIWTSGSASVIEVPAFQAEKVVDPTGCGDAYRAGLMYGLKHDYSLEKSAQIGAWIAAKAIVKAGTQNHKIERKEFEKFLKSMSK